MASLRGLGYVSIGVLFFATSPVLTRWAAPLSPIEITFGRMAVAALALLLVNLLSHGPARLRRADLPRFALYSLPCALHFFLYAASLSYTTIAHSLALVYTAPVFVTALAALLLGEPIARRQYGGLIIAVIGVALLTGFEPTMTSTMALGDALALGSALCFGFYSVIGRRERARYSLVEYSGAMYGGAAVWLALPLLPLLGGPVFSTAPAGSLLSVLLLGLLPLALGHTLYNASLRRVHPTYVNLIATQEVTGGVLLGYFLLGEVPSALALIGSAITLIGVVLVLVCRPNQPAKQMQRS
ncbi:MAG: DMT family transporter [Chloroflexota bacterium]